jgi:hypothetical protein
MSLNPDELDKHCHNILNSRRAKNKIVILCEGQIIEQDRRSPQSYGRMAQMPDSSFYDACVPNWWTQHRPEFFNCGSRNTVIKTYFQLLKLNQNNTKTYLDSNKLFALVDLDSNAIKLPEGYQFSNTEEIFYDLYQSGQIQSEKIANHRIWVTGLIHKEAYFICPELQEFFDQDWQLSPQYQNQPVTLSNMHQAMIDKFTDDPDLMTYFFHVIQRIDHDCLDISTPEKLAYTFKAQHQANPTDVSLIHALLTIKRPKTYYRNIQPPSDWTSTIQNFHEQLELAIGRFYSQQSDRVINHLTDLFRVLHHRFYA